MHIGVKRVYEAPETRDGTRILVDRIWPRGLSKDRAHVDVWLKAVAPSSGLRKWFAHDPRKWAGFCERYFAELDSNTAVVEELLGHVRRGPVTLLYSARNAECNNALALRQYLDAGRRR